MTGEIKTAYTTFSKKNNKYDMNTIFKKKFFFADSCQMFEIAGRITYCGCITVLLYARVTKFLRSCKPFHVVSEDWLLAESLLQGHA